MEKWLWAERFARHGSSKDDLARLVEQDHDEAEVEFYEAAADPTFVLIEQEQRRYRGALRRRMRRRND